MLGKKTEKEQKEKKVSESVQNIRIVAVPRTMMILAAIFSVTWTLIGLSILTLLVQGQRKGAFLGLTNPPTTQGQGQTQQQVPTETVLPGIGRVNIACVQSALSPESIQKLVSSGNISVLEGEEKTKFEACLVK